MKYWIYKDARILGPFERDAMAGLPGFDAGTMVCAGESAGAAEGQWSPASDIPDLAPLTLAHGPTWSPDAPASSFGLLDKLQIESAGLIGDDQYPSAAEVLFQDAEIKKSFAELLVARTRTDDTEVRRLRGLVSELSVQLELMYRRIAQLENTHTDFLRRLASPEAAAAPAVAAPLPAAASAPAAVAPPAPPAAIFAPAEAVAPAAAPVPSAAAPALPAAAQAAAAALAPVAAPPSPASPEPSAPEWPAAPPAAFPNFSALKPDVPAEAPTHEEPEIPVLKPTVPVPEIAAPSPAVEPMSARPDSATPPEEASPAPAAWAPSESAPLPPLPPLPEIDASAPVEAPEAAVAAPIAAEAAPTPAPVPAHKLVFDKPKTLRVVPTLKAFRVVGAGDAASTEAAPNAVESAPPPAAALPPMPSLAPTPSAAQQPFSAPELAPSVIPAPPALSAAAPAAEFIAPAPIPIPVPAPAPVPASAPEPAPFLSASFPATGSLPVAGAAAAVAQPPATAVFSGGAAFVVDPSSLAPAPATQEVLARLAKPAAPPDSAPPRRQRSNKKFLIIGGALAGVLIFVLALLLRRTRASDLNTMASLDDGKPQLGAEPVDDTARPPVVKPPMAPVPAPAPAPVPAPPPPAPAPVPAAPSPLDVATSFVENFPLDGNRGTVSKWLDFSYMASPDSGQGLWNANQQADGTYLVEYHFVPAVKDAPEILYLFEADPERGYVLGKNQDARDLLAGGGPGLSETVAARPKPKKRRAVRRRASTRRTAASSSGDAAPGAVPQLPLPSEGQLRAPAEDDGDFGSDTVKSDQ